MFGADVEVKRIALTLDQIELYNPPPNPAKLTDARASGYISRFGRESWELDALEPSVIKELIEEKVFELIDYDLFQEVGFREQNDKTNIHKIATRYDDVVRFVND